MAGGRKDDQDKPRWELMPPEFLKDFSKVLTYGAKKYGARNWEKGIEFGRLFGALQRHLWDFWEGIDTDPESGLPHLAHAACMLSFLHTLRVRGRADLDDRMVTLSFGTPSQIANQIAGQGRNMTPEERAALLGF